MKGPLRIYHDEEGDFLEIAVGLPTKCYAEEVAAMLFDLVFVWHRYIRHGIGLDFLRKLTKAPKGVE